jgi:uncharacterized membrane protein YGL010W
MTGLILFSTADILNFEKQYTAYAIFHQNDVNKISHELCVWPILWTFYCMFHHSGAVIKGLPFTNHAFFAAAMYVGYYLSLQSGPLQDLTILGAGLVAVVWLTSGLVAMLFPRRAAYVSSIINIFCWIAQFYTHGKHEGRAPALLKNPAQAFFLAPIFVLLEGLSDHGLGDVANRTAVLQPNVVAGVKLLDDGKYAQVSQLEFHPLIVAGFTVLGVCLAILPMYHLSSVKGKAE